jgi:hypothetical protein
MKLSAIEGRTPCCFAGVLEKYVGGVGNSGVTMRETFEVNK